MKTDSEVRRGTATRRTPLLERGAQVAGEAARRDRRATASGAPAARRALQAAARTTAADARARTRAGERAVREAPARPRPDQARPRRAPAPRPGRETAAPAAAARPGRPRSVGRTRPPRAPFVLLLVGLLCGGLISLLLLNIVLAQESFRASELREENRRIAEQQERTRNANARLESAANLDREARRYGVYPDDSAPEFITPAPSR